MANSLLQISRHTAQDFIQTTVATHYLMLLFCAEGEVQTDYTTHRFSGHTALFVSPCQHFSLHTTEAHCPVSKLAFHGDFYCIEYHKQEVVCNGLLFNNIYLVPHVALTPALYAELQEILLKVEGELSLPVRENSAVLRAYLQLLLALCSRSKTASLAEKAQVTGERHRQMAELQELFDQHFLCERSPSFYAGKLSLTPDALTKRTKAFFGKTPVFLIQERVVLEAKRQLHLTTKSIKEIAALLHFNDEFYFSRYFKRFTGTSPTAYRKMVGISVVAK